MNDSKRVFPVAIALFFAALLLNAVSLRINAMAYATQKKSIDLDQDIEQTEQPAQRLLVPTNLERATKTVLSNTVTIRAFRPQDNADPAGEGGKDEKQGKTETKKKVRSVAVFSGVIIRGGFVAAPLFLPDPNNPTVRLTLPNGKQAIGRPRILDEYSGLAIIQIDEIESPPLELCNAKNPKVGSWVVSGSAWGGREALVSFGIVSGVDFRYPDANLVLPPLLVCDLPASKTSKGSGIVSADGKLIGIVLDVSKDNRWTYAVPVCHLHNLIRTHREMKATGKFDVNEVLVLKRQRPFVGINTDCRRWNPDRLVHDCVVERVNENSPAEKAGLLKGDILLGMNDLSRRHGMDFVGEIRIRQPGDTVRFNILRDGNEKEIELTLGGRYKSTIDRIVRLSDLESSPNQLVSAKKLGSNAQLWNIAKRNLEPPSCDSSDKIDCLSESLQKERMKNAKLLERMKQMEDKLDRLLKLTVPKK